MNTRRMTYLPSIGSFGVIAMYEMRNPVPLNEAGRRNTTVALLLRRVTVSGLLPGQYLSAKQNIN